MLVYRISYKYEYKTGDEGGYGGASDKRASGLVHQARGNALLCVLSLFSDYSTPNMRICPELVPTPVRQPSPPTQEVGDEAAEASCMQGKFRIPRPSHMERLRLSSALPIHRMPLGVETTRRREKEERATRFTVFVLCCKSTK
jgi:hypothetical protein